MTILRTLGSVKTSYSLFSEKLHNREWFKLTDDDIQQVKELSIDMQRLEQDLLALDKVK